MPGESVRTSGEAIDGASPLMVGGKATAAVEAVDEGDAKILSLDLNGNLRTVSTGTGTSADQVQGNIAHDSAEAGNPVSIGGIGSSTPPTSVTANDRVRAWFTLDGQLHTRSTGMVAIDVAISGNPVNMGVRASTDAATQATADTRCVMPSADRLGRVRVTTPAGEAYAGADGAWTLTSGVPAAASVVLKASAGRLSYATCLNSNAAVRFLQIHNVAAVLSGGEVPVISEVIPVTNGAMVMPIDFKEVGGARFATGITIAFSTTRDTFTAATANENFYKALTK